MNAPLEKGAPRRTADELARSICDRIRVWNDPVAVAGEAAELLAAGLSGPLVSVYRLEAAGRDFVLMGAAPHGSHAPTGGRLVGDRALVDAAARLGTAQRVLDDYVVPDFVHSLPGETRSTIALPIRAGDRVLGVVHLEYPPPSAPGGDDEEAASRVADVLGVAWAAAGGAAPASGEEALHAHVAALEAVRGLSGALAQSDDFGGVLERVPRLAMELLGCGGVALLTRHETRQMLEVTGSCGSAILPADELIPIDATRVGEVARSGRPFVHHGDPTAEPILPEGMLTAPVPDALAVPVASAGKTIGVILAVESRMGEGFGPASVRLLQAVADQAGAAEAMRSIGPLRQKISDASLIAEVGRSLTGTLGLEDVLALVVRGAELLVSGRFAGVALLSEDRGSLTLAATSGALRPHRHATLEARETVVGWVALSGESTRSGTLGQDPRGWPLRTDLGPAALVPLESRGQIRGVLLAGRAAGADRLTDDDLDALRKLGAYAGIAIDNARLYGEQTELSNALEARKGELENAYADLHASQERLLVSEKMAALGRVTAGIAHEINSPLGSILNCLQLAITYGQEYLQSATDPEVTPEDHVGIAEDLLESLHLAEEATRRVGQFVRTIKGQTRMEEERVIAFHPAEVIRSTLNLLHHESPDGRVTFVAELADEVELRGDPNKFAVVVQNLLSNASDSYEGREGPVTIRLKMAEEMVVLEVEDAGSGIPEEVRPRIFDYLFTTKDIGQGTGLGLSLVHSIVTSTFQGTISFRTEVGAGTTFVVTIPIRIAS